MKKKLWITYAWEDNKNQDVDFLAQEIERIGLTVRLDRWDIKAGLRIWEQIGKAISSPSETDGWLLFASSNSLASQPCREEMGYAVGRALEAREDGFPVLALFKGNVPAQNIPPAIKSRLYLRTEDPDWKERLLAALERRNPKVQRAEILSYHFIERFDLTFEIRPRFEQWNPVFAAFLLEEFAAINPTVSFGPPGGSPSVSTVHRLGFFRQDGWQVRPFRNVVSPAESMYIACRQRPSKVAFGVLDGKPQFCHSLNLGENTESVNIGLGRMVELTELLSQFWQSDTLSIPATLDLLLALCETTTTSGVPLKQLDWVFLLKFSDDEGLYLRDTIENGLRPLTTKRVYEFLAHYRQIGSRTQKEDLFATSLVSWMRMLRDRNGELTLRPLTDLGVVMANDPT